MADGITSRAARIRIQQVLHGYADGHRQLATSINLKSRDLRTMLVYSDVSGPGASFDETGYLTGYPLLDVGAYAIARTWAALEMPRPGCVWTHTLLIDFADLATLGSLSQIMALFNRPVGPSFSDYEVPLLIESKNSKVEIALDGEIWARRLLASLYGKPRNRIIAARKSEIDVDALVLAIWVQQWPRLRRSFRFCTFAVSDRSTEGATFDLQLLPSADRNMRTRFPNAIDADNTTLPSSPWLEEGLADLVDPDCSGLREFLKTVGADVSTGREAFRPLCQLHMAMNVFATSEDAVEVAISILSNELDGLQARAARTLVVEKLFTLSRTFEPTTLNFLLENFQVVNLAGEPQKLEKIGRALWRHDLGHFVDLLRLESPQKIVAEKTLDSLSNFEIIEGLDREHVLEELVLARRPGIVSERGFWETGPWNLSNAFKVMDSSTSLRDSALWAMLATERTDLAAPVITHFGLNAVICAIESTMKSEEDSWAESWIDEIAKNLDEVAEYLGNSSSKSFLLVAALAYRIAPPAIQTKSVDPWLNAVITCTGTLSRTKTIFLCAHAFCRALLLRSDSAGPLATFGFETIYGAASDNCLPEHVWLMLDKFLISTSIWTVESQRERIARSVVTLFVNRDLSPLIFLQLTKNDQVFLDLVILTESIWAGKSYLRKMLTVMQGLGYSKTHVRVRQIRHALGDLKK